MLIDHKLPRNPLVTEVRRACCELNIVILMTAYPVRMLRADRRTQIASE